MRDTFGAIQEILPAEHQGLGRSLRTTSWYPYQTLALVQRSATDVIVRSVVLPERRLQHPSPDPSQRQASSSDRPPESEGASHLRRRSSILPPKSIRTRTRLARRRPTLGRV